MEINTEVDADLLPGAYNAINVCLRLKPEERITIIADNDAADIARAMEHEIKKVGAEFSTFIIEDYTPRPIPGDLPQVILDDLAKSQVSIFAATPKMGELRSRASMTYVVDAHKIRHGHMVNINKQIMMEGMRADFIKVDKISQRLIDIASKAKIIKHNSDNGTDITAEFVPELKWLKTSGIISRDKWGNLPGGEIFTSPWNVNGTFVVDGVVGDYLCQKYGDLLHTPLTIEIKDSRIAKMTCDNKELLEEFTAYTMTDENSNRVVFITGCSKNSDTTVSSGGSNQYPTLPSNPAPVNGAVNISGFVTTTWDCSDPDVTDSLKYDVFWGTTTSPSNQVAFNTVNRAADIGVGAPNTTIYWRVIAKDNHGGVTNGTVWSYKTAP
ncbi:unnamed protein product [Rotaria sp. Silwood1]|nr:unnamed protein product [Rotaria sp. Silwood1]